MHRNRSKFLVRLIAVVTAGTALYVLLPTYWKYWWETLLWALEGDPVKGHSILSVPVVILFNLILLGKLLAIYGLFRFRLWGRNIAICALTSDFLLRLAGAVNMWTFHLRHPNSPSIPAGGEYVYVGNVSAIPSYVIGLLSLISVIILTRKNIREAFLNYGA